MKQALLKYMLILSMGINLGSSMENSINDEQIDGKKCAARIATKDSSIIHGQSKQNDVIDTTPEDVTMQINSEVGNKIEPTNQINLNSAKQNPSMRPQEDLSGNIPEPQENIIRPNMKLLCQINRAAKLQDIWQDIDNFVDENTLIVLDIDQTILTCKDLAIAEHCQPQWEKTEEIFAKKYPQYAERRDFYIDIFLQERKEILTSNIWKEFINHLKSRGEKVLVATAIENAYILDENLQSTETMWIELRHKQLNYVIDEKEQMITNVFDGESSFSLNDPSKSPYYFQGILATQPWDKGKAVSRLMLHWLRENHWKPKKLVVIDDQLHNLQDFINLTLSLNMRLMGYHFTGAHYISYKYEFDPRRAFFQQLYLVKNNKWLSDEAAENALKDCTDDNKKELDELMELYNKPLKCKEDETAELEKLIKLANQSQKCHEENKKSEQSNTGKSKDN